MFSIRFIWIPVIANMSAPDANAPSTIPRIGTWSISALARELSGFIPVGGVFIKAAIAYAGTVVVGEGVAFYYRNGRQMGVEDAARVYDEAKASAMTLAREILTRFRGNSGSKN